MYENVHLESSAGCHAARRQFLASHYAVESELRSGLHDSMKVKSYFNKLAGQGNNLKPFPLSESQIAADFESLNIQGEPSEGARENIEALKIQRASNGFLRALKNTPELWSFFLEYFHSEENFHELLDKKRFASALSGLMKTVVDHDIYLEQKSKETKFRQEAEIVEKHKAYLLAMSSGGNYPSARASGNSKLQDQETVKADRLSKYKSYAGISDQNDQVERDILKSIGSPRADSQQYELVLESKRKTEDHHISSSRLLPKYDLERVRQLAMEAESGAKEGQVRVSKAYKPKLTSSKMFAEDGSSSRNRSNEGRRSHVENLHLQKGGERGQNEYPTRKSPGSPNSPSKLDAKRHEYKQKKSSQKSLEGSPEVQRPEALSDGENKATFMEKMKNFDYSNLRKPRVETENQISSKLAKDAMRRQKSREKKAEDYANRVDQPDRRSQSPRQQGKFIYAYSDEEQRNRQRQRADVALEYSDNEDDPLGFASGTLPKQGRPNQRNSSPAYPPRSPGQGSQNSRSVSQKPFTAGDGKQLSSISGAQKKLTPLVPESQKSDVYSRVQKQLNQKEEQIRNSLNGKTRGQAPGEKPAQRDNSFRSGSETGSRPEKGSRMPKLDHQNKGYVPANQFQSKQFVDHKPKNDFNRIKSSGYGKVQGRSKSRNGDKSDSGALQRGASPQFKDVRSLVDSILKEGKRRVN